MRLGKLFVLVLLATGIALASPILVNDFSFETLPVSGLPISCGGTCVYSNTAISGWTESGLTGITGQLQQGNAGYFTAIPNGVTFAYTSGGVISQTVAPVVQLGVTYTLQVDVGLRAVCCTLGTVDLMIGGTSILATGITPTAGNFSTFTATYTGLAGDVGKTIGIQLSATHNQGDFDNVRLNDSTIRLNDSTTSAPEPGTAFLGVLGLAAMLPVVRMRLHRRG
jgi:hypothetical protein